LEELKVKFDIKLYQRNKDTFQAPPELEQVHPLGKSPVVVITPPGEGAEPIVLAESGHLSQYLCDHFPEGRRLVPQKWKEGMENQIGGETEAWLRNQYFLHYSEGSFMPYLLLSLVVGSAYCPRKERKAKMNDIPISDTDFLYVIGLRQPPIPFFIRPITSAVADRIFASFIFPNIHRHIKFLDQQLRTSGGRYLCCDHLAPADIILSFPLFEAKNALDSMGQWEGGSWKTEFPRVVEYIELLENEDGYKKSTEAVAKL
jgi:glutathione S-transferase